MPERQSDGEGLSLRSGQPLIGVVVREGGQQVTRYFTEEQHGPDQAGRRARIQKAAGLAGAWKDLDWDQMEQSLHRIRHESTPTPPTEEV
jgi:hypothetical protein